MKKNKIKILIAYHKNSYRFKTNILTPIHVGRSITNKKTKKQLSGMIGDDTGENISSKNPNYCELTAMFWAWKNYNKLENPDYIGFSHYRRLFKFNESQKADKILSKNKKTIKPYLLYSSDEKIKKTIDNYDLILPKPDDLRTYVLKDKGVNTIYGYYENEHCIKDLDLAIKIIKNKYPNFTTSINKALHKNHNVYWANMFIMKKELFFNYSKWLFSILDEIECNKNFKKRIKEYDSFQSRVYGFLAERLFNVYIQYIKDQKKKIKIQEIDIVQIKPYFTENKLTITKPKRNNLKTENINLFFTFNDNFIQHFLVALASILINSNKIDNYHIYILTSKNGLSKINKKRISSLQKLRPFQTEYINISNSIFTKLPLHLPHLQSSITYYKFLLPIIKPNLKKVIYLDCDLVTNSDLYFLWKTDISNFYAAGVEDCHWSNTEHKKNLGIKETQPYINAGVMILNLKKLREDNLSKLFFKNLEKIKNKIKYDDQDVFNYSLKGKIKLLSPKWNLLVWISCAMNEGWKTLYNWHEMKEATQNPGIVHYAGETKPWNINQTNYQYQHPNWKLYFKYLLYTPFKKRYFIYIRYKIQKIYKFLIQINFQRKNHIYNIQLIGIKIDFSQLFSVLSKIYKKIFKHDK